MMAKKCVHVQKILNTFYCPRLFTYISDLAHDDVDDYNDDKVMSNVNFVEAIFSLFE